MESTLLDEEDLEGKRQWIRQTLELTVRTGSHSLKSTTVIKAIYQGSMFQLG
jgi:hypothetical protein